MSVAASVLGTGAWGTTFARVLADAGVDVTMWGRDATLVEAIGAGENPKYLPGVALPESLRATTDLEAAVGDSRLVVLAVPVAAIRQVASRAVAAARPDATILLLAKGIEPDTLRTVADMVVEETGVSAERVAVLSGPNLSAEIAARQPTATVIACSDQERAAWVASVCHNEYFRPYVSDDVLGCEIAGATKNVIAVAIGAAEGMGLGINTRSTLITRGLAEMTRLGTALGADPGTFAGLAGIGDLVTTCSSRLSRNYSMGFRLGSGMGVEEALAASAGVVEGVRSAAPVLELASRHGVDMPITRGVVQVVSGRATVAEMGEALLARPRKMDGWRIELV